MRPARSCFPGCRLFRNRVNMAVKKPRSRANKSGSPACRPGATGPPGAAGGSDVMPTYRAPVDEVMFLLSDVLHVERYNNLPGFAEATPDIVEPCSRKRRNSARACSPRSIASATRKVAGATMTARSPRRRVSRKPTKNSSTAAGSALRRPPSSAARACRRCSPRLSASSCTHRTWPSTCIRA